MALEHQLIEHHADHNDQSNKRADTNRCKFGRLSLLIDAQMRKVNVGCDRKGRIFLDLGAIAQRVERKEANSYNKNDDAVAGTGERLQANNVVSRTCGERIGITGGEAKAMDIAQVARATIGS